MNRFTQKSNSFHQTKKSRFGRCKLTLSVLVSLSLLGLGISLLLPISTAAPVSTSRTTVRAPSAALKLVENARQQIGVTTQYDPAYTVIAYPAGDVPYVKGVCTDVVIRALRQQGIDLQVLVHQDMEKHFHAYPGLWKLHATDPNIDHRRVPNLETFFQHSGKALPAPSQQSVFLPGDIVTWRIGPKKLPHIGIISDQKTPSGVPLVIHNVGRGTQEEDVLWQYDLIKHFRWHAPENQHKPF